MAEQEPPAEPPAGPPRQPAPPVDAGEPPVDAGEPPVDAGEPAVDAIDATGPPVEAVGLPEVPDGQRQTVPLRRRWTASAPVPVPRTRRRLFRRRPPTESAGDGTGYEPTLDMPAEELAALLRRPAPEQPLPAPPSWAPLPQPWTPPPQWTLPPGWVPPPGWAPPPGWTAKRRRRRWPWVVMVVSVLAVGCCCGCPALIAKPFFEEYPVTVSLPTQAAGLVRVDDEASRRLTADLKRRVRSEYLLVDDVFAAVYTEPETSGKNVTLLGAARLSLDPDKDLKSALGTLSRLDLTGARALDAGPLGGEQRCAAADGGGKVVCGWADHGSIGVAVFTAWSIEDGAKLLQGLRSAVITRS